MMDSLTGLRSPSDLAEIADTLRPWCVAFDIAGLAWQNDQFGFETGDRVLVAVAKLLKQLTQESDLLFRYSGEEFLLIPKASSRQDCVKLAKMALESCEALHLPHREPKSVRDVVALNAAVVRFREIERKNLSLLRERVRDLIYSETQVQGRSFSVVAVEEE